MALLSVEIENLRCIGHAQLELDSRSTLICGPNGSGKSSILEAIYLLGRGRSFRASRLETVIKRGCDHLRVVGRVTRHISTFTIGIEVSASGGTLARIAGEPAISLARLSTSFPVQIIEPGIHKLIEDGPLQRRRFLDWGVFHVEQQYLENWQRFNRVLRQRNAALQAQDSDAALQAWDMEFVDAGEKVTTARRNYLQQVQPFINEAITSLLPEEITIEYGAGWPTGRSLAQSLEDSRRRDRQRRTSTTGPHRADIIFAANGQPAKQFISRGQQKLLATAALLGQLRYHRERTDLEPTLLLDDPAAELDEEHLRFLIEQVTRLGVQLVITSLNPDLLGKGLNGRMFHVEHGQVLRS